MPFTKYNHYRKTWKVRTYMFFLKQYMIINYPSLFLKSNKKYLLCVYRLHDITIREITKKKYRAHASPHYIYISHYQKIKSSVRKRTKSFVYKLDPMGHGILKGILKDFDFYSFKQCSSVSNEELNYS